jgi:hypothetical protein
MFLTEDHLIFAKGNKETSKRWEITIPLNSVILEQWNIKSESRRKQITDGGCVVRRHCFWRKGDT